jgi:hypothetical protein
VGKCCTEQGVVKVSGRNQIVKLCCFVYLYAIELVNLCFRTIRDRNGKLTGHAVFLLYF